MLFVFFVLYFQSIIVSCDEDVLVTCGSVIKLKNTKNGRRLHSHDLKYGSGSGQQSVTAYPDPGDSNSYWVVHGGLNDNCPPGTIIKHGQKIRLNHVNTGLWLHSHLHQSPLSRNQEVSCYHQIDTGDNWFVYVSGKGPWKKSKKIKLQHVDTKKYLFCDENNKFRDPIPNQLEVAAVSSSSDKRVFWQAEEGLYREEEEEEE